MFDGRIVVVERDLEIFPERSGDPQSKSQGWAMNGKGGKETNVYLLSLHDVPQHIMAVGEDVAPLHHWVNTVGIDVFASGVGLCQPDGPLEVPCAAIP